MALRLGDEAPNFQQDSTEGVIDFHEWLGDSWGILFSHPADFTPVCTTELGRAASLEEEFARRNVKPIALSVDSVAKHEDWLQDIAETQGYAPSFPLIADEDRSVAVASALGRSVLRVKSMRKRWNPYHAAQAKIRTPYRMRLQFRATR